MNSKHYIAQVSDTHLLGNKNAELNGVKPFANLRKVLDHISVLEDKPDFLIVTGDISQDATLESYVHLRNFLESSKLKYYMLPGNHDDLAKINQVFGYSWESETLDFKLELDKWFIYVINTSRYPHDFGEVSDKQLQKLKSELRKNRKRPTVVFMHHHPISVNSAWIDAMGLKNSEKFCEIIKANKQVQAVLFGHIHHVFEKQLTGTLFASAPSTVYQVFSARDEFLIEKRVPGYRVIELSDDNFSSRVVWVK